MPSSPAEAVQLFGDGAGTTVIGGGTVVIPELTHGRLDPGRVLLLAKAGLGGVSADGATVTIGAAASIESLLDLGVDALAACARNVADVEIRGQATVGGNLCVAASARRRAATCRAACSRSGAGTLGGRRRRDGRSRSTTSSPTGAAGSSST